MLKTIIIVIMYLSSAETPLWPCSVALFTDLKQVFSKNYFKKMYTTKNIILRISNKDLLM